MDTSGTGRRIHGLTAAAAARLRPAGAAYGDAVHPVDTPRPVANDRPPRQEQDHTAQEEPGSAPRGRIVIQAVDTATGRVLWQIPVPGIEAASPDAAGAAVAGASILHALSQGRAPSPPAGPAATGTGYRSPASPAASGEALGISRKV